MARYLLSALVALALVAAGTASATSPAPVTFSNTTTLPPGPSVYDPFTSTGNVVCATGSVSTRFELFGGWQSGFKSQLLVGKHFVCSDGTFDVLLRVTLDFATGSTTGTWSVVSGTAAYEKLHGEGRITGERSSPSSIDDEYEGSMHID